MKHIQKILKKSKIIKASPSDTLSKVLGKLKSSHDAAFIFDKSKKFLGIINPYYAMIKTSAFDGDMKVEHALFHPPHIQTTDSLERIVKLMNESKVHYLPVFDDKNKFIGITSARRVLAFMRTLSVAKTKISKIGHTRKGRVLTVLMTDPISKAQSLFKEYKTSKIVAVDKNGKLRGIVSHYDLIPYLIAPGKRSQKGRRGEKPTFKQTPVKNYAKTLVLTMRESDTVADAIDNIIAKEIGSIILIDNESKPIGIVTTRDILDVLRFDKKKKPVKVTAKHQSKSYKVTFDDFVACIDRQIQSKPYVSSAEIIYEEEKNGLFLRVHVHLVPVKGKLIVVSREGKDFSMLLQDVKEVVRRA